MSTNTKEYSREYYYKNREKILARANKEKQAINRVRWASKPANKEKHSVQQKLSNLKRRLLVLNAYSNNDIKCACCGEKEVKFMSIDHINNDGAEHRKKIKSEGRNGGGTQMYCWLIKNNFPEGFQVLCHNCNMAKGFYGACPHSNLT